MCADNFDSNPLLYIYFAQMSLIERGTVQKTTDNVSRWQAVILGVPFLIAVERWGMYKPDFRGSMELGRGTEANRRLSPPLIREVGSLFRGAIARDDQFDVKCMVGRMDISSMSVRAGTYVGRQL